MRSAGSTSRRGRTLERLLGEWTRWLPEPPDRARPDVRPCHA